MLGLTSMIGQIIILRESLTVFYGNELCLGIILSGWLFWVGIGGALFGRVADKIAAKEKLLSFCQIALSITLPATMFIIRSMKFALKIPAGEIIGLAPTALGSFLSLSAICVLLGFTFTLLSKISAQDETAPSKQIAGIYLLEGLGAAAGGLLHGIIFIKMFSSLEIMLIMAGLNIITSFLFTRNIVQIVYVAALLVAFMFKLPGPMDKFTKNLGFRPLKVVDNSESIYGNITVTKMDNQFSFYENGLLVFTTGDLMTTEESTHYAMLTHPAPKKILLVGGGVNGGLDQILKHKPDRIDYVELDPMLIKLGEKYIGPIKDKRINIILSDGRAFVKEAALSKNPKNPYKYDVVILNLPDPTTALLNRFYSVQFFREVGGILNPGGVFSFSLSGAENYIGPERAIYLSAINKSLEKQFSDVKVIPGEAMVFCASKESGALTNDAETLLKRLRERRLNNKFVNEYYLPYKLNPMRIKYMESMIRDQKASAINDDFRPAGYFYNMLLWMGLFDSTRKILPYADRINIYSFLLIAVLVFIVLMLAQKLMRSRRFPILVSITATGGTQICLQMIIILSFQFIYGYMYYKLGLILASFMLGLALGGFYVRGVLENIKDDLSAYLRIQLFMTAYPLILAGLLVIAARINETNPFWGNILQLEFLALPLLAGFLGAVQFILANKICLNASNDIGRTTGLVYGFDLFGSCAGGILAGVILIPMLGIIQTCVLLTAINILIFVIISDSRPCFSKKV